MCIIIFRPTSATRQIDAESLYNSAASNSDGMGLMYAEHGTLHVHKQLKDVTGFVERVLEVQARDVPLAVHFRLATHGAVVEDNCHPFLVTPHVGMMHNGILSDYSNDKTKCDSARLADETLAKLPRGWHRNDAILTLLTDHIGRGNKLAILTARGEFAIVNDKAGFWEEGVWYSNSSFRRSPVIVPSSAYTGLWRDQDDDWYDYSSRRDYTHIPAAKKEYRKTLAYYLPRADKHMCAVCANAPNMMPSTNRKDDTYGEVIDRETQMPPGTECVFCRKVLAPGLSVKACKQIRKHLSRKFRDGIKLEYRVGNPHYEAWQKAIRLFGFDGANLVFPMRPNVPEAETEAPFGLITSTIEPEEEAPTGV